MGRESDAMTEYMKDNERFADLFNGSCFGGKCVVSAKELQEGSEVYVQGDTAMAGCGEGKGNRDAAGRPPTTTRIRDVKKVLRCGSRLRVLAIENQSQIDYCMPWRHMNYDALEYGEQIRGRRKENQRTGRLKTGAERMSGLRKEDRLTPTYTLCLYHGTEKWDGPRSLKDMMDFGDADECWKELFSDYRMHLICLNEMTDFSGFHSPLKELFELLAVRDDRAKVKELLARESVYEKLDEETAHVAGVLMGVKEERMGQIRNQEEESYNMCRALREMIDEGKAEGRMEGRKEGRREGRREGRQEGTNEGLDILAALWKKLENEGRMNDWLKVVEDKIYRNQLLKEYGLMK